jgi:hypothetical protein
MESIYQTVNNPGVFTLTQLQKEELSQAIELNTGDSHDFLPDEAQNSSHTMNSWDSTAYDIEDFL